jgi:hypothetical protein
LVSVGLKIKTKLFETLKMYYALFVSIGEAFFYFLSHDEAVFGCKLGK